MQPAQLLHYTHKMLVFNRNRSAKHELYKQNISKINRKSTHEETMTRSTRSAHRGLADCFFRNECPSPLNAVKAEASLLSFSCHTNRLKLDPVTLLTAKVTVMLIIL